VSGYTAFPGNVSGGSKGEVEFISHTSAVRCHESESEADWKLLQDRVSGAHWGAEGDPLHPAMHAKLKQGDCLLKRRKDEIQNFTT